jgi:hypothetical protein
VVRLSRRASSSNKLVYIEPRWMKGPFSTTWSGTETFAGRVRYHWSLPHAGGDSVFAMDIDWNDIIEMIRQFAERNHRQAITIIDSMREDLEVSMIRRPHIGWYGRRDQ